MIAVLHYQETDKCSYFISTQLFIEVESEEALFLQICEAVETLKKKHSISDADILKGQYYIKINGTDVPVDDLLEKYLDINSLDEFLKHAKPVQIVIS